VFVARQLQVQLRRRDQPSHQDATHLSTLFVLLYRFTQFAQGLLPSHFVFRARQRSQLEHSRSCDGRAAAGAHCCWAARWSIPPYIVTGAAVAVAISG